MSPARPAGDDGGVAVAGAKDAHGPEKDLWRRAETILSNAQTLADQLIDNIEAFVAGHPRNRLA